MLSNKMVEANPKIRPDQESSAKKKSKLFRSKRRISPLIFRILAINLIALGFLAGGILYIDQYENTMTKSRINALIKDAEIIAGALGEAGTVTTDKTELNLKASEQIIVRIVSVTKNRTRLFDVNENLVIDSQDLAIDQLVVIHELPLEGGLKAFRSHFADVITHLLDGLSKKLNLETYHEVKEENAQQYPEVMEALIGEIGFRMRLLSDGSEIITVAVPVQRFRRVLGALMVSGDTRDIRDAVQKTRMTFLKFFGVVLAVTLLLSFFLARTIVRPILRLASAADRISAGTHTSSDIPDYSGRNDEVGDLSCSLKNMTLVLARQIDAVAVFAADVSHELKNPLTSLRSAVETLSFAKTDEAKEKLRGIIADDVMRLDRLISDIAMVSRLDAEMSHGQMAEVNLNVMMGRLVDFYNTSQKGEIPRLHFDKGDSRKKMDNDYNVLGLEGQLGQLFRNLIDNAISFSQKEGNIWIRLSQIKDMVQVTVEDEGPGIPKDKLEDIFDRFYTERPKGEAFGKHSGLGLSICKRVVEVHGGVIIAKNRYNEDHTEQMGARFIVQLHAIQSKTEPTL